MARYGVEGDGINRMFLKVRLQSERKEEDAWPS
jgi:hypothetical protein